MLFFLLTDIENSTPLWDLYGQTMLPALLRHNAILEEQITQAGGRILERRGDGLVAAFENANPLPVVLEIQRQLGRQPWGEIGELRIRIGLHGVPEANEGVEFFRREDQYYGPVLNHTARIMAAGWGGQILASEQVRRSLALPDGSSWLDFGWHDLKGVDRPQRIFGLTHPDLPHLEFPPLHTAARPPGAGDRVGQDPLEQRISYCRSWDGTQLAYAASGSGAPLVKAANWLSHLEFDWHSPVWRHWLEAFSRDHTLIRYDERGCGLSEREVAEISFEAWVRDLEAVVDAAGLERFVLLGLSKGASIATAYAARHPERVTRLVLYGGYARGRELRDVDAGKLEEIRLLYQLVRVGWGKESPAFRQVFTTLFIPEGTPEQLAWFNELQRISAWPQTASRIIQSSAQVDVSDLAKKIEAPTLVMHARQDALIPLEEGRRLAGSIPGARFVLLEGKNHILLENEPAWGQFMAEVKAFLEKGPRFRIRPPNHPRRHPP
ncbi:MAG TPA: alpha/beta fold hydrolase [Anaerolineales bacterium]